MHDAYIRVYYIGNVWIRCVLYRFLSENKSKTTDIFVSVYRKQSLNVSFCSDICVPNALRWNYQSMTRGCIRAMHTYIPYLTLTSKVPRAQCKTITLKKQKTEWFGIWVGKRRSPSSWTFVCDRLCCLLSSDPLHLDIPISTGLLSLYVS